MKAVIFDLGRVLVGYEHQQTAEAIASMSQVDADEIGRLFDGIVSNLEVGQVDIAGLHHHYVRQAGFDGNLAQFTDAFCAGLSRMDDALAYAVSLRNRHDVVIGAISNTYDGHVQWLEKYVPELQRFDVVITSNAVGMAKPGAGIYHLALERLGLDTSDAIFIDDVPRNVQGAQAVGMTGIVHADWTLTRPQLERWLNEQCNIRDFSGNQ